MNDNQTGGEGGEVTPAASSEDTSLDFASGFDSAADELMADLPQDAAAVGGGEAAPDEASGAPGEPSQEAAPPAQPQEPAQPQVQQEQAPAEKSQEQSLFLDSAAPLTQILQTLVQNEDQLVQAVAKQMFQLSDADKEALQENAEAAMPALGARVYVKSLQAAASLVQRMVPQMLQTEINKHQALMTVEQAFFQQFPQLDRWTHGRDIVAVGQALRAQNPQMPPQDLLRRIASAVMGMHGIQPGVPKRQGNGQRPFSPAPSGAPMGQPNLAVDSPFAGLGLDYED